MRFGAKEAGYFAGLLVLTALVLMRVPESAFAARGPLNTGHQDLPCESCHRNAPGTLRQQLQANVQFWLQNRPVPAPIGRLPVENDACLSCHQRRNERHPVFRYLEPRFAKARSAVAPHLCGSCHREHSGRRVTLSNSGFCVHCHEDLKVKADSVNPTHEALIAARKWDTCLGCHDFHGNHVTKPPTELSQAISPALLEFYFEGGSSPYSAEKYDQASRPESKP